MIAFIHSNHRKGACRHEVKDLEREILLDDPGGLSLTTRVPGRGGREAHSRQPLLKTVEPAMRRRSRHEPGPA